MDLSVKQNGSITIVTPIEKNLNAAAATSFKAQITDLIMKNNKLILLDLINVTFLDSSGLGALISILKNLALQNGEIVLCGLQKPLISLFQITRMNQVFKIANDENEGIELLKNTKINYV